MDDFVAKPFDMERVVAVLLRLCGQEAEALDAASAASTAAPLVALDERQGLTLWKNQAAYAKQLQRFVESYASADGLVADALAQGDAQAATGLAHKLRGAAGSLALPEVARCAGQIERALAEDGDAAEDIQALGAALDEALAAIAQLTSLAALEAGTGPCAEYAIDPGAVAPLLAELLRDLDQDAPNQAEATLDALAEKLPEALLKPIHEAVDEFDFRGAEARTLALAQRLGIDRLNRVL
jgi:two-component system sensor histidine kinase/response regulator